MVADIFKTKLVKTKVEEEAAFGAAILAGVGIGIYHNLEEAFEKTNQIVSSESPDDKRVKIYEKY